MGCMIIISIRSVEMMVMMIGCSYISGNLLRVRAFSVVALMAKSEAFRCRKSPVTAHLDSLTSQYSVVH